MKNIKNYEITILLRSDVSVDDIEKFFSLFKNLISEEGKFLHTEYWGLIPLEYLIKKNQSAHFYFFGINSSPNVIKDISNRLKISDSVIRFLIVKSEEESFFPSCNIKNFENSIEETVVLDEKYKNCLNIIL